MLVRKQMYMQWRIDMKKTAVITGGGSGMGLSAAEQFPKDKVIIIAGRTQSRLDKGVAHLRQKGFEAYGMRCDTSDRSSVRRLAEFACTKGVVTNVINAAGVSPAMADPDKLIRINALGTVHVNREFAMVMDKGSVIEDVSSNSAYEIPDFLMSRKMVRLADEDEEMFERKLVRFSSLVHDDYRRRGFAYALSKLFVCKYAQECAFRYGSRGIRVISVSPGLVSTDMGNLEKEEGKQMIACAAGHRMGKPEELGYALAVLADERNGYLNGVDVLCDGGSVAGQRRKHLNV